MRSSGQIDLNLSANGFSTGAVRGDIHIVNATLTTDTIPVGFEGINGQIQITGDRFDIRQFEGKAGGGEINAGGFLIYGARSSNYNVNLGAQKVRLRYPEGLRSVLSGDLRLTGTAADSTLSGRVILRSFRSPSNSTEQFCGPIRVQSTLQREFFSAEHEAECIPSIRGPAESGQQQSEHGRGG